MKAILLFCVFVCACDAYKILVVFPLPGKSHAILGDGVIRQLLHAGHQVTSLMPFEKDPHPNLTQIIVDNSKYFNEDFINIQKLMDKEMNMGDMNYIMEMMTNISINTIAQDITQKLFKNTEEKFDAVVAEWMFCDLYSTISAIYQCPFIWFSTVDPHWQVIRLIDEALNSAYAAHILSSNMPPFTLKDRVLELWEQVTGYARVRRFNALENEAYQKIIIPLLEERGHPVPEYDELVYNASLMLGNSHVSLGGSLRLPQSYKPIGGYHIETNTKPLTGDLKKIVDNANDGLIYFSMGSNLKSKDLPQQLKTGLLKVFSELKQTVLWKFEEVLPNLPKNVHIVAWAPQPSILAHPNTILFITHGGLLSTSEAIHFGKPMIGIPVFADQFANVAKAMHKGFGRKVDLTYNMDADLREELKEIIGNPKYTEKAKEWSFIYHDRPVSPGKELVHWVEHVINTKGAPHLRSPALLVPWYQRMYFDLLILIIGGVYLLVQGVLSLVSNKSRRRRVKKKNA